MRKSTNSAPVHFWWNVHRLPTRRSLRKGALRVATCQAGARCEQRTVHGRDRRTSHVVPQDARNSKSSQTSTCNRQALVFLTHEFSEVHDLP